MLCDNNKNTNTMRTDQNFGRNFLRIEWLVKAFDRRTSIEPMCGRSISSIYRNFKEGDPNNEFNFHNFIVHIKAMGDPNHNSNNGNVKCENHALVYRECRFVIDYYVSALFSFYY